MIDLETQPDVTQSQRSQWRQPLTRLGLKDDQKFILKLEAFDRLKKPATGLRSLLGG